MSRLTALLTTDMNFPVRIIISSLTVLLTAYFLSGIHVDGYATAIWVAFVLALLNGFLRPLLILFTIPITLMSLGLFLLVINAAIILLTDHFVDGFYVDGFWWALLFSLLLSAITFIMEKLGGNKKES